MGLTTSCSCKQCSYNQGFLEAGVLQPVVFTTRGSYNQGFFYNQGSYNEGFLQRGLLTTRGLTTRGSCNQGFLNRGSGNQGFLQLGALQPGVLTTRLRRAGKREPWERGWFMICVSFEDMSTLYRVAFYVDVKDTLFSGDLFLKKPGIFWARTQIQNQNLSNIF